FKEAITACLDQCHTTYKRELDSLLTLRFQSFKKVKAIP
ncbi:IS630 family transposase, partial [Phormidesmis priestleyi ANT.L61.2]